MFAHLSRGSDQHKSFLLIEEQIKQCAPPPAVARQMREVFREQEVDGAPLCRCNTKRDQQLGGGRTGGLLNKSKGNKVGLSGSQRHGAIPPITSLDSIKALLLSLCLYE